MIPNALNGDQRNNRLPECQCHTWLKEQEGAEHEPPTNNGGTPERSERSAHTAVTDEQNWRCAAK